MPYKQRIKWETMRTIDASSLTGGYDALGTPLTQQAYKVKMINNSDTDVLVSIDESTDIDICPDNSFFLYDESVSHYEFLPKGTQFFVKGTAGTGTIYLVVQYLEVG